MSFKYEIIQPKKPAKSLIIWLHGLGSNGYDFLPIVPELNLSDEQAIRFIFPHASLQPVTLNMGLSMPSWYDIYSINKNAKQDQAGILKSFAQLSELIHEQHATGIPYEKIALAGFSQGGALALFSALTFPEKLAGVIALSTYLPIADYVAENLAAKNSHLPIFLAHGIKDQVVLPEFAMLAKEKLSALGYKVNWHEYPIAHELCRPEVDDIATFISDLFTK